MTQHTDAARFPPACLCIRCTEARKGLRAEVEEGRRSKQAARERQKDLFYIASYHAAAYAARGATYAFGASIGVLPVVLAAWWLA